MILRSAFALLGLLLAPALSPAGVILSEDVSVSQRDPLAQKHVHESLLDSMDVLSLSPSARFLAMPRPMITPELARAMKSGRVHTPDREWARIIRKAAGIHGLPEELIASVIHTESAFQARAESPKGAQGAMQIMPQTQQELGLTDPFDPEANVLAGCAYLRRQLDRFGSLELALAAYNAGPANVKKYGGIPPFPETRDYVARVTSRFKDNKRHQDGAGPKERHE
jgi:soluble lytic murein transglycosylase-like protein